MCGQSTHLHQAIREDMKMNSFDVFGYLVPPKVAVKFAVAAIAKPFELMVR